MDTEFLLLSVLCMARRKRAEIYEKLDDEIAFHGADDGFATSKEKAARYCIHMLDQIIWRALVLINHVRSFGPSSVHASEAQELYQRYKNVDIFSPETAAKISEKKELQTYRS